jgi:hypothetical protein
MGAYYDKSTCKSQALILTVYSHTLMRTEKITQCLKHEILVPDATQPLPELTAIPHTLGIPEKVLSEIPGPQIFSRINNFHIHMVLDDLFLFGKKI